MGTNIEVWYLDSVSVNDTVNNIDLLINGGFDTGDFTGWQQMCNNDTVCGTASYAQVVSSSCYSGSNCCADKCGNRNGYDYLFQSFATIIGDYYVLSFYLKLSSSSTNLVAYVTLT